MSKISGINGVGSTPRIGGVSTGVSQTNTGPISFEERFQFPSIELEDGSTGGVLAEDRVYRSILISLFVMIVEEGIDIIPRPPSDRGSYIVEASFRPARDKFGKPQMILPLRGVSDKFIAIKGGGVVSQGTRSDLTSYVDAILDKSSDSQILRLLVVASHEFGHYLSYIRGNHDRDLSTGLYLFHRRQAKSSGADKFTWLVFREECTAWDFAREKLLRCGLDDWSIFDQVKKQSLRTYYDELHLAMASIDVFCKLNLIGDDFLSIMPKKNLEDL